MLKNKVLEWAEEHNDGEGTIQEALEELTQYGCQSGMVGSLIYYSDTVKFYEENQNEIDSMLAELMDDCGIKSPAELFGDKWDASDPFARDTNNQNLLAWFGFEETANRLLSEMD